MTELNVNKFCDLVFDEGTCSTLIGLPGSGKTNLAVDFMDMLTLRGSNCYTNISFFPKEKINRAIELKKLADIPGHKYIPKNSNIGTVRSLSELFIGMLSTEDNVTILDEGGIHASSGRATSARVQTWKEMAFIIRHLSSSLMLIAQSKGSIVPDLRETLVEFELRVRKVSPYDRMFTIATSVEMIDDLTGDSYIKFEIAEGDEYHNIPPCRYPFDSKDFPYFDMDLNLHEALKRLKEFDSISVRENNNGINVIKELMGETRKEKKYLSTGQYGKIHGVSAKTVWQWIKDGKLKAIKTEGGKYRIPVG